MGICISGVLIGPKFTSMKSFGSVSASQCCQINQCDSMKNASFSQFLLRFYFGCFIRRDSAELTRHRQSANHLLSHFLIYLWVPNSVGGSSWPAGQSAQWHALQWKTKFTAFPACWSRARQRSQTAAPDSVSCSSYSLSREEPSRSVWVNDLKLMQQSKMKEGKKERKKRKMNKTQRSMRVPPVECVHMCAQGLI